MSESNEKPAEETPAEGENGTPPTDPTPPAEGGEGDGEGEGEGDDD